MSTTYQELAINIMKPLRLSLIAESHCRHKIIMHTHRNTFTEIMEILLQLCFLIFKVKRFMKYLLW